MIIIIFVSFIIVSAIIGNIYTIRQNKKYKDPKQQLSMDLNESILDKVEEKNIIENTAKAEVEILKSSVKMTAKKKPTTKKKPSLKK